MSFTVVIPARFASTRLPGKPLSDIAGTPMIVRVCERATESKADSVLVACDDERVLKAVTDAGFTAMMTAPDHPTGTDRIAEVVERLDLPDDAVVVNVQGDEPEIQPAIIDQTASLLADDEAAGMATLCTPVTSKRDAMDPSIVKVVCDGAGHALYFSRAPIPWDRSGFEGNADLLIAPMYRHIGIYAYRAGFLRMFSGLPPCETEQTESLEQLRALHVGVRIRVAEACEIPPPGIDTEVDLERVRKVLGS